MKVVIIGGVAGGATAAARLRRLDERAEIIILERTGYVSYANCGLPYYVGGVITDREELTLQTPEGFRNRFGIDVRVGQEAVELHPEQHTVTVRRLEDGSTYALHYDKLLLSPGARPVGSNLPGEDDPRVFTLRTVEDTLRIRAYLDEHPVRRAVVVGGGFIGLEMAENLIHAGVRTTMIQLDDQVLLKRDGLPTYNFANVVDDHLMGITHVVRGSEYLSSAPKYNLLYEAFGWDIPTYVHCSPVMRDQHNKMSKRHGDPSYEDLKAQGYLTEAILNYVALLGWAPKGERSEQEIFSLSELVEAFDIAGISKSPAIFDIDKLTYFNATYLRAMAPEDFAKAAEPYIREAVKNPAIDVSAVAALLQARCEKLTEIPEKVDFFDQLPDYGVECFTNKKSKTNPEVSQAMLEAAIPALEGIGDWTADAVHDTLIALAEHLGVKNATLMWPVRIAAAGKAVTPGGAVEICHVLGREETLRRLRLGLDKLR